MMQEYTDVRIESLDFWPVVCDCCHAHGHLLWFGASFFTGECNDNKYFRYYAHGQRSLWLPLKWNAP